MTEQTESMIRLLKTVNGKKRIVGYEYIANFSDMANEINNSAIDYASATLRLNNGISVKVDTPYNSNGIATAWLGWWPECKQPFTQYAFSAGLYRKMHPVDFDSFNLSFKFGDKWVFEGDKVEIKRKETIYSQVVFVGVVEFKQWGWYFQTNTYMYSNPFWTMEDSIESITVTGNIYESKASHE